MAMRASRNIREGMVVYDVDGHKVGTVDEVAGGDAGYLKVKTGLLGLGGSSYIPLATVREVRSDDIYLDVAKDDADRLSRDASLTPDGRPGYAAIQETAANRDRTVTPGRTIDPEERRTVELREEELHAWKEPVQVGEVRVDKEVVTEQQTIDVPVTHEEVAVEWHPARAAVPLPALSVLTRRSTCRCWQREHTPTSRRSSPQSLRWANVRSPRWSS